MKYIKYITFILIMSLMSISLCGCSASLPKEETLSKVLEDGGYELVFEDNFDGSEIDMTTWIVGYPEKTRSAAYYTEDAVTLRDGNLVITTDYREDGVEGKGWYTGWIESADSTSHIMNVPNPHVRDYHKGFSTKYGYIEARCKLPRGKGMWSAFWLMPCNGAKGMTWDNDVVGTASDGVEIDIMESFNYHKFPNENINTHVVHMDGYTENLKSIKSPLINIGSDLYNEFHTYGVLWTENEYIFYIDGKESWRTDGTYEGKNYGVSKVEECILLTAEVPGTGIDHPGQILDQKTGKYNTHWSGDVMQNDLTQKYEFVVDYVKVYKN